jgi:hypothetical protein
MSSPDDGWAATVSRWAHDQPDISALVQIGSRVQKGATADQWSDFDYQLITSRPGKYRNGSFARDLGPCWAYGAQVAFGNATKVTAVYAGALEADFVVLSNWEVRVAMAALRWPRTAPLWPRALEMGVLNLKIVAAPGWDVIKGGEPWRRRYSRIAPARAPLGEAQFSALCGEFWTQLVWAAKKADRGEFRASQRALHLHLLENSLRILQEEALLEGRQAFPFGRRAETWMTEAQSAATDIRSAPDRASLLAALEKLAGAFEGSSSAVAARNGWSGVQAAEIRAWLAGIRSRPIERSPR